MSLVFFDGFDFYNSLSGMSGEKWNPGMNAFSTGGRWGGQAIQPPASGSLFVPMWDGIVKTVPTHNTYIVGFAAYFGSLSISEHPFFYFANSSTPMVSLWINPTTHQLEIRQWRGRGNSPSDDNANSPVGPPVILASTTTDVPLGLWFYVEFKYVVGSTVEMRINGSVAATGVDGAGVGNINQIHVCGIGRFGPNWACDDLCVLDDQGTFNTDYLGEVRVQTQYPSTAGYRTDFIPNTGNDHIAMLTNYYHPGIDTGNNNHSMNPGDIDSYAFSSFAVRPGGHIYGVQSNIAVRKDDVGSRVIKPTMHINTAGPGLQDYTGDAYGLYSSYTVTEKIWEKNPATDTQWQLTDLNATEFGVKMQS